MLRTLHALGFAHVVATPHMRPGMFDNERTDLLNAFARMQPELTERANLPQVSLGSEHFFDASVVEAILRGEGLPYRPDEASHRPRHGGAILVEFSDLTPLPVIEKQLFLLQTKGYLPVIAHPERYRAVWDDPECLARLVELGSVALLDVCALIGKYGQEPQRASRALLADGLYDAACTDSHRPEDVERAGEAMAWIKTEYGSEELHYLFDETPNRLLAGTRPASS